MSLTAREIEEVVAELQSLVGAFVQKVYLPEPRTAIFEVRQPGASHLLLVCAESGRTRLHVAGARPPSPEQPFAFQGLLRADLTGLAIERLEALPGERAARIAFRGNEGTRVFVAELTGRHGNLFVLDEKEIVRGSAVPNLSDLRDNRPGKPYVPPFARDGAPPDDRQSRFPPSESPFAISIAIERIYSERERAELVSDRRSALLQGLRARRQRVTRTLAKVQGDLDRAGRAEEHLRRGQVLKANLGRIKRGMREVTLVDYTESGPVEVRLQLDPARGPKENLEREFHQYRRLLAGQTRARARYEQLQAELAELELQLQQAESLDDEALLRAAPQGSIETQALPRKTRAGSPSLPFREYLSAGGQRIRVGKGARENDALTFRHSKGNDLWLHARGVAGAHVVVPLGRDEAVRDETLRDAALLAAQHSAGRGDTVEVAWTRVKYVHKTKGAPGAVTYSQEKSVSVRPDPERLARLVASQP